MKFKIPLCDHYLIFRLKSKDGPFQTWHFTFEIEFGLLRWLVIILLAASTASAQSIPLQPVPIVRVQLTDNVRKWYEPLPVRHRTADRKWIFATLLSAGLTFADVENSLYALHRAGTAEDNPIFGRHPSRDRYYAIALPGLALATWYSWKDKREDDALRDAGLPPHKYIRWWLYPLVNGGSHAAGIAVTAASTGR